MCVSRRDLLNRWFEVGFIYTCIDFLLFIVILSVPFSFDKRTECYMKRIVIY